MESLATEKQVLTLKKLARNPELSREVFRGIEFEKLNKREASELISKCFQQSKNEEQAGEFRMRYSQNFKDTYGNFRTATLTAEELAQVREAHREHCKGILLECEEDYPEEEDKPQTVFDKRCDKIFTWIQQALDEKVRKSRNGLSNGFKPGTEA